jgi:F-type H+-transporting ATPase subunit delta
MRAIDRAPPLEPRGKAGRRKNPGRRAIDCCSSKMISTARLSVRSVARRSFHRTAFRADDAAAVNTDLEQLKLNFSLPHETIYTNKEVDLVIVPGAAGQFGITAGHTPNISQLQAGVVEIHHEKDDKDPEKFFVSGGFSLTHDTSVTDLSCIEAVRLDDIDIESAKNGVAEYQAAFDSAAEGTAAQAEAQIGLETFQEMVKALE